MIIDKALQVSNGQAVTATAASTDVIDFGQKNPDLGATNRGFMVVTCGTTAAAAGAATVTFSIQDSADGTTFADVISSAAVPVASLVAGYQNVLAMPTQHRRYVRLNYTVATGPLTAGKFSAQVVAGYQQNVPKPDSPRIS